MADRSSLYMNILPGISEADDILSCERANSDPTNRYAVVSLVRHGVLHFYSTNMLHEWMQLGKKDPLTRETFTDDERRRIQHYKDAHTRFPDFRATPESIRGVFERWLKSYADQPSTSTPSKTSTASSSSSSASPSTTTANTPMTEAERQEARLMGRYFLQALDFESNTSRLVFPTGQHHRDGYRLERTAAESFLCQGPPNRFILRKSSLRDAPLESYTVMSYRGLTMICGNILFRHQIGVGYFFNCDGRFDQATEKTVITVPGTGPYLCFLDALEAAIEFVRTQKNIELHITNHFVAPVPAPAV